MPMIDLIKYQALGNDYLVLDLPAPLDQVVPVLPAICDRHFGLGSDGLLAYEPETRRLRIFNPDSSEAQKSGNGLRITAAHAVLVHQAGSSFELLTVDRANPVRILEVSGSKVVSEIEIGQPSFRPADLPAVVVDEPETVVIETAAGQVEAMLVSVGNPHCVVFGEEVERARCEELGPLLENHPMFPERTNVQLVEVLDRNRARIEIWERGAGYTLASGTSASAVAAALMRRGLVDGRITIVMPGGNLDVRRDEGGNLVQSGPAQRVYSARLDLADFS